MTLVGVCVFVFVMSSPVHLCSGMRGVLNGMLSLSCNVCGDPCGGRVKVGGGMASNSPAGNKEDRVSIVLNT